MHSCMNEKASAVAKSAVRLAAIENIAVVIDTQDITGSHEAKVQAKGVHQEGVWVDRIANSDMASAGVEILRDFRSQQWTVVCAEYSAYIVMPKNPECKGQTAFQVLSLFQFLIFTPNSGRRPTSHLKIQFQ